jgi:hypothetical protein
MVYSESDFNENLVENELIYEKVKNAISNRIGDNPDFKNEYEKLLKKDMVKYDKIVNEELRSLRFNIYSKEIRYNS